MELRGQAFRKATSAIEDYFPAIMLPQYQPGDSLDSLLNVITAQTLPPGNSCSAIQRMKAASDAQQYRIQRNVLEMDKENHLPNLEDICYELPSTGMLGEKELFARSQKELSVMGDKIHNLIDEVWWNHEKKNEESEYFIG